jgi:membrane-bound lytic murein transglycosylase F
VEYLTQETRRLSSYDALFREGAERLGWDWRLLASQAYQESRFDPAARSWAGAEGLLQLMPSTAREVKVRNRRDPKQNVDGSVRYLEKLGRDWTKRLSSGKDPLPFVLASYNVGTGHVDDARRLARKNGGDPDDWETVAYWLTQLAKKNVYEDPAVRLGYARGTEPVQYVSAIFERYDHYRQFVGEPDPEDAAEPEPEPG